MRLRWSSALVAALVLAAPAAAQGLAPSPHTELCFLDVNGDGARGIDEPVYLQTRACAGGTDAGDVRLSAWGDHEGGTILRGDDSDAGRPTVAWPAQYAFTDEDGSGSYTPGDLVYLHAGALPGAIGPADLRITGAAPFSSVAGSDPDVGRAVAAAPVVVGGESYQEFDGFAGYSAGDRVFLDMDASTSITVGDIRLGVPAPPTAGGDGSPPAQDGDADDSDGSDGDGGAGDDEGVPGEPEDAGEAGEPDPPGADLPPPATPSSDPAPAAPRPIAGLAGPAGVAAVAAVLGLAAVLGRVRPRGGAGRP